jgi:hypothetical protein
MGHQHWAVTLSVLMFILTYAISAYACILWFSTKVIPANWRERTHPVILAFLFGLSATFTPVAAKFLFVWAAASADSPHLIEWSRYRDYTIMGFWFVWFIVFKPTVPAFIVGTISPDYQGFATRKHVFAAYGIHLAHTAAIVKVTSWTLH